MNTPIKLPYGISNFEDLVTQGYYYVDKTDYIEKLEALPDKIFFFLRPRRFGKSLFISMLHHYYGLEHKDKFQDFFGTYYIGQNPTPLANEYLVVRFEFTQINTDSKETTLEGFLETIRNGIREFGLAYPQFFTPKEIERINKKTYPAFLMSSLILLIKEKAPQHKLYILVDEYDHFANQLIAFHLENFKDIVSRAGFMRKFYEAIKEGTALGVVDRFFSTGVTPITLDSMTSGFNIATPLTRDFFFAEMMGFTEDKVRELFRLVSPKEAGKVEEMIPVMKEWYNGYKFHEDVEYTHTLYNPNMVLYFLKYYQRHRKVPVVLLDGNIASDYYKVRKLLTVETPEKNYATLRKILEGEQVRGRITAQFSFERMFTQYDFLSLLYYNGFLTIDYEKGNLIFFKVPNYVIQKLYFDYFLEILQQKQEVKMNVDVIEDAIFEMAFKGSPQAFFEVIHNILHQLANRDYQRFDEKYVKLIMITTMMLTETFHVDSERETPAGYLDLSFIERPNVPVDHQYLFELKYLKKENAKKLKSKQNEAKKHLFEYIEESQKFKFMKNLQAWTVVVIKDELTVERIK